MDRGGRQANRLTRLGKDRELEVGSAAHYEDPAYYTKTYRRRAEDVRFYVELAERRRVPKRGPGVLEYGVGNGRIALPLARRGFPVTGVDLSAPMLADFARALDDEPDDVRRRVTLRRGDMRAVRLKERFPLVTCPFNALLHLYVRADFERFFARVREHLAPGGRFVFDISLPSPDEQVRDPERAYHSPRFRHPTLDAMVSYTERFDHDPARQILFVMMEFSPVEGRHEPFATPLAHRQIYPLELEALLHYNGLELVEAAGGFDGARLDRDSDTMVCTCRARPVRVSVARNQRPT